MANVQQHVKQWKHNRELVALIPSTHPDWIVTTAFYTALHAVDALLAFDNVTRITCHKDRNMAVMQINRYIKIRNPYLTLHDLSRKVRYLADPGAWVPAGVIEKDVLSGSLYPIENSVQKLIGQDLELGRITLVIPPKATGSASSPAATD